MPKNIALSVKDDVSDQMAIIESMAESVRKLHEEAEKKDDPILRARVQQLAANLRALSQKAYDVGEKILECSAA